MITVCSCMDPETKHRGTACVVAADILFSINDLEAGAVNLSRSWWKQHFPIVLALYPADIVGEVHSHSALSVDEGVGLWMS